MGLRFAPLDAGTGVEIVDRIENRRFVVHTPSEVSPTPADTAEFAYPVSAARAVVTRELTLPRVAPIPVRDAATGDQIREGNPSDGFELGPDEYLVELVGTPVKLYLRVDSSLRVGWGDDSTRIAFGGPTRVRVGARSYHRSPAATITVPDDPEAAMDAISAFGSALKTPTSERSWATLRGHPPRLELGDELSIPEGLEPPDSGVTIRVPPEYEALYPLVPLAYYLGAEVVPGTTPRLTTESGFTHRLDTLRGFEDEVARVLKQVFVLDCVARLDGYFSADLHERHLVESNPAVDLDFEALHDAPMGDRLEAYLSVPLEAVEDAIPTWDRTVHVRPSPECLELLPVVASDLSVVRVEAPTRASSAGAGASTRPTADAIESFKRGGGGNETGRESDEVGDDALRGVPDRGEYVPLPDGDSIEKGWVGEGTPVHGTKLLADAFRGPATPTDGVIQVTVVCNSEAMRDEWDAVSNLYGNRELVPFDVDCEFEVTSAELRDLLAADTDLFHFIGHIDGRGFECADGILDAETLDRTGATVALLNACRSHNQGRALVEAGARASIVSLGDVGNAGADEVGETLARLLNYGFTVGGALSIVESYTAIGHHYVALGDPGVAVAQCADGSPHLYEISAVEGDLTVTPIGYTTRAYPVGSMSYPFIQDEETYYLSAGPVASFDLTAGRFRETFADERSPLVVDGELVWSDELFADEIEN
ncbi:CHAT domain-containing protein [Halorussus amylolyticus]|uniref:CHAT domain-containing protein n=1 Tax=Halorussus amylolyticus TaxID=1126242 RepID=UPI0010499A4B|nr:CHAT domain-containing protein [Halorussus amylolyticus]